MQATFRLSKDWDDRSLRGTVGDDFDADRPRTVRFLFLDTYDWRIAAAGARLTEETADGRPALRFVDAGGEPSQVLPLTRSVRFVRELPESVLRARLESLVDIRALLPVGECRVERQCGRLRSAAGDTAALLTLETATILDSSGRPAGEPVSRIDVLGLPGFDAIVGGVIEKLRAVAEASDDAGGLMELAVAARGRRVGDYSSKLKLALERGQSADSAVRSILHTLLDILRANVDGVIADHDTEFLHDFRVATRRTRAALGQLKGVLPGAEVEAFREEFRWLGSLTNPCRDLDVYLLEMDDFRSMIGASAAALAPLQDLLMKERAAALRKVRVALRSRRFQRLLDEWQEFLEAPTADASSLPDAARPVSELSSQKIWKAYRRMRRHGIALDQNAPLADLHRLRILGKKLRYLLEFFRSLYDEVEIEPLVEQLKLLQDILGGINDVRVQQQRLLELAHRNELAGQIDTLLAMGRLSGALQQRQDVLRGELAIAFPSFAGAEGRARYRSLFGGGE